MLRAVESAGLIVISIATIIAGLQEVVRMLTEQSVTLADLLLLFIYLEVMAMVAIYVESHTLPVRLPMYIAIVALARYLILDIKEMDEWRIFAVSASILFVALAVLVVRFGHNKYPYQSARTHSPGDH